MICPIWVTGVFNLVIGSLFFIPPIYVLGILAVFFLRVIPTVIIIILILFILNFIMYRIILKVKNNSKKVIIDVAIKKRNWKVDFFIACGIFILTAIISISYSIENVYLNFGWN